MGRLTIILGLALFALAAGLYFAGDESDQNVTIADTDREIALTCGETHLETFRIHNPKRRVIRVIGLADC
jgi:hypothetical protein